MGEYADDALNGMVCQCCGEVFDDIINGAEEPGYPRSCECCEPKSDGAEPLGYWGSGAGRSSPRTPAQQEVRRAKNKRKRERQKVKRAAARAALGPPVAGLVVGGGS